MASPEGTSSLWCLSFVDSGLVWCCCPVYITEPYYFLSICAATEPTFRIWIYLLVLLIVTEIKETSVTHFTSGWTECLECMLFHLWDWPVGESPSLVAVLSGEADGVLFLLWPAVGTSNVGFFGSSGTAGLAYNKHKTLYQLFIHKNLIKKWYCTGDSPPPPPPSPPHLLHLLFQQHQWRQAYRLPAEQQRIPAQLLSPSGPGLEENLKDKSKSLILTGITVLKNHILDLLFWSSTTTCLVALIQRLTDSTQ